MPAIACSARSDPWQRRASGSVWKRIPGSASLACLMSRRLAHVDRVGDRGARRSAGRPFDQDDRQAAGDPPCGVVIDLTTLEGADTAGKCASCAPRRSAPAPTIPEIPSVASESAYTRRWSRSHGRRWPGRASGPRQSPPASRRRSRSKPSSATPRTRSQRSRGDRHGDLARGVPRRRRRPRDAGGRAVKDACGDAPPEGDPRDGRARLIRPCAARVDAGDGGRPPTSSKTSTGKAAAGATPGVCLVMLEAIRDHVERTGRIVGFKAAAAFRRARRRCTGSCSSRRRSATSG